MHRVHVLIRGQVQGVGFRYFALRRAHALGVAGWVRNRADGAVEIEAEGARQALEGFVAALGEGPPAARVEAVDPTWAEGESRFRDFDVTG
jgi:acylphosphatase